MYIYKCNIYTHICIHYIYTYIHTDTQTKNGTNGKRKFVFLSRQTINGNWQLLCQQTCLSVCKTAQIESVIDTLLHCILYSMCSSWHSRLHRHYKNFLETFHPENFPWSRSCCKLVLRERPGQGCCWANQQQALLAHEFSSCSFEQTFYLYKSFSAWAVFFCATEKLLILFLQHTKCTSSCAVWTYICIAGISPLYIMSQGFFYLTRQWLRRMYT